MNVEILFFFVDFSEEYTTYCLKECEFEYPIVHKISCLSYREGIFVLKKSTEMLRGIALKLHRDVKIPEQW